MKHILLLLSFFAYLIAGEIKVAVATNVSYALPELTHSFQRAHPDIKIKATLASSGLLTSQIKQGAAYGLFLSADMKYPNYLYKEGLALHPPKLYAQGTLALFSVQKRDFSRGMDCLKAEDIRKIALAHPKSAPYGRAAFEALTRSGLADILKSKLIFAESISQTLSYALTAADVGIIAQSTLSTPKMKKYPEKEHWIAVDPTLYEPINQGMVLLKSAQESKDYQALYEYMLGKEAQAILKKFGYMLP